MTILYFYKDDYIDNPRDTEGSNKVVRLWYDERVRYANEDIPDDQCMRLVAERLMIRHLLGINALDMAYMPKASQSRPFGLNTPMLAELLMPGTFFAMALVPLSPKGSQGKPIVARLYCVAGLSNCYVVPLDGMGEKVLQGVSWFLAGVPQEKLRNGVVGRSWLLAANLLARIVEKRDVKTARNLAKHYIVTGDVSDGIIRRVEMLRKPELAKQFDNFKWIIPKENDMDMPKRKIEKPENLEEAYRMIESMRSTATRSFFRFLRECNLAGVKEQYRIGADIFAREKETGLTCLEVVADMKKQLYAAETKEKKVDENGMVDREVFKRNIREQIDVLDKLGRWLRLQGSDASMLFYLMAVNEDAAGIVRCCEYASINSCDEHGNTAVDLALIEGDIEAARLLHRYGGAPNPRLGANEQLSFAIQCFCDQLLGNCKGEVKFIANAIDVGFPPEAPVVVRPFEYSAMYTSEYTSLYAVAVSYANFEVLEACLRNGADPNKKLLWTHIEPDSRSEEGYAEVIDKAGTPWAILSARSDMKGEKRQKFRELLLRYGACITEE